MINEFRTSQRCDVCGTKLVRTRGWSVRYWRCPNDNGNSNNTIIASSNLEISLNNETLSYFYLGDRGRTAKDRGENKKRHQHEQNKAKKYDTFHILFFSI